jgi:proton-dependent oligopeptide transporter, POT family
MQAILLICLYYSAEQGGLGIDRTEATSIVGAYGGLVYLSTILGAWLADRLAGAGAALFASAVVVMCRHLALSLLPDCSASGPGWSSSHWAAAG